MNTLKQINRILELHKLIQAEATGSAAFLALRLRVSKRSVGFYLEELRILGAQISYDCGSRTYYYTNSFDIQYHLNVIVDAQNIEIK